MKSYSLPETSIQASSLNKCAMSVKVFLAVKGVVMDVKDIEVS